MHAPLHDLPSVGTPVLLVEFPLFLLVSLRLLLFLKTNEKIPFKEKILHVQQFERCFREEMCEEKSCKEMCEKVVKKCMLF